ncbi:MAG: tetratricopeptide repeat protein [Verrucomicrobia bacterium]|nr:tetratricopeptide repeat protein [Verrucomicrobiota bacterium]
MQTISKWLYSLTLLSVLWIGLVPGCGGPPAKRELDRAEREISKGRYVRAKARLEKAITKYPGSDLTPETYNLLGVVCWRLGEIERAVDSFEASRRSDPDLFDPTYNLAVLYYAGGDVFRAATLFEEAALVDINEEKPLLFLGDIYLNEGKWAEARRALSEALERSPYSPRALTALAVVELNTGGPAAALSYLMQALEKNSKYPPALYNLALINEKVLGNEDQARAFYKQFLKVSPDSEFESQAKAYMRGYSAAAAGSSAGGDAARSGLPDHADVIPSGPSGVDFLLAQAGQRAESGFTREALHLCLRAAALAKKSRDGALEEHALRTTVKLCPNESRAHYELGRFLMEKGKDGEALTALKQAVTLSPEWSIAHMALAEAAVKNDEHDTALLSLKKATQVDPQNSDAAWLLAELYDEELGLKDKAIDAYHHFERFFPDDPRVMKAKSRLQALTPEPPRVKEEPKKADRKEVTRIAASSGAVEQPAEEASSSTYSPQHARPQNRDTRTAVQAFNRGTQYQQKGDWDRAIYYYRRAIDQDPDLSTAHYNIGCVYRAKGAMPQAKDSYINALRLDPEMTNARYNLALVYWEMKQYSAALEHLKTIIRKQPDYPSAHYVLGMIYAENSRTWEQARQHYRRFLQLDPQDPKAPSVRRWLDRHASRRG